MIKDDCPHVETAVGKLTAHDFLQLINVPQCDVCSKRVSQLWLCVYPVSTSASIRIGSGLKPKTCYLAATKGLNLDYPSLNSSKTSIAVIRMVNNFFIKALVAHSFKA